MSKAISTSQARTIPKDVWIGWVSSLVEAYNMSIYTFVAPLLGPLLFKNMTEWAAVFFSYFLVFISTCLFYPLGAIYFGSAGDRKGRQQICVISTLGLAVATGLMGMIPLDDYALIGFLLMISAQSFFSGGEYYGSIVFSLEHSEQREGGLISSLSCLFAVVGLAAANGFANLSENLHWIRICFFIGALGGLMSYLLKYSCCETPAFKALSKAFVGKETLMQFMAKEWQKISAIVLVFGFFIVSYSFIFLFLPLVPFTESGPHHFDTFKSLIAYGLYLVTAGWLADRFGIQKIMLIGICLFVLMIFPLAFFCRDLLLWQLLITPCACLVIGPIHSFALRQFSVEQRCRGIFISSAIATSIFWGSTVPILLLLYEQTQSLALCSLYPVALALCALGLIRKST